MTMRIEVIEDPGFADPVLGGFVLGDIRTVPKDRGAFFCANGWAKDLSGVVATGFRGCLDQKVNVANYKYDHAPKSE